MYFFLLIAPLKNNFLNIQSNNIYKELIKEKKIGSDTKFPLTSKQHKL